MIRLPPKNNPKVHRKPAGETQSLLGGIEVVFENDYKDPMTDRSGHFMNFYLPKEKLYVSVVNGLADWIAPGKHIMYFRRGKGPKKFTNAQFDWMASNFQQAMLTQSGAKYVAHHGNDAYDIRHLTEFMIIAEPHEYETLKALVPSEDELYEMMFRNPAPAAIYKALKTGADLDLDKLATLPEKQSIKMIEEKFGKDSRKAKAMTVVLKAKIKAIEKTGDILRKMPVSNPKVRRATSPANKNWWDDFDWNLYSFNRQTDDILEGSRRRRYIEEEDRYVYDNPISSVFIYLDKTWFGDVPDSEGDISIKFTGGYEGPVYVLQWTDHWETIIDYLGDDKDEPYPHYLEFKAKIEEIKTTISQYDAGRIHNEILKVKAMPARNPKVRRAPAPRQDEWWEQADWTYNPRTGDLDGVINTPSVSNGITGKGKNRGVYALGVKVNQNSKMRRDGHITAGYFVNTRPEEDAWAGRQGATNISGDSYRDAMAGATIAFNYNEKNNEKTRILQPTQSNGNPATWMDPLWTPKPAYYSKGRPDFNDEEAEQFAVEFIESLPSPDVLIARCSYPDRNGIPSLSRPIDFSAMPNPNKNPVEMVDDMPVDIMQNYYSVIYRRSRTFDKDAKGNRILRYPKNMQKAAVTITTENGAKVRAGLLKGKWAIQAVLIPRRRGMTKRKAVKLSDEVVSRLTRSNAPRLRMNPTMAKPDDWQDDIDWDNEPSAPLDWGDEVEWDEVESNPSRSIHDEKIRKSIVEHTPTESDPKSIYWEDIGGYKKHLGTIAGVIDVYVAFGYDKVSGRRGFEIDTDLPFTGNEYPWSTKSYNVNYEEGKGWETYEYLTNEMGRMYEEWAKSMNLPIIDYSTGDDDLLLIGYPEDASDEDWKKYMALTICDHSNYKQKVADIEGDQYLLTLECSDCGKIASGQMAIQWTRRNPKVRRSSEPMEEVVKWPFSGGEPAFTSSAAKDGKVSAIFSYKKEEIKIEITKQFWKIESLKNWSLKKTNDFMKTLATILPKNLQVEYIVNERTTPYKAYCKAGWNTGSAWVDEMVYKPEMRNNPKVIGIRLSVDENGFYGPMSNAWLARWVKSGPKSVSKLYDMWDMQKLEL